MVSDHKPVDSRYDRGTSGGQVTNSKRCDADPGEMAEA